MPSANNSQMFNGNVPLIDFSEYTEGPWSEKTKCRDLLTHCLATYGFARLINCGVKDSNVDKAFNLGIDFFKMPTEFKNQVANAAGPNPQRGWSHLGAESSSSLYGKLIGNETAKGLSDAREHFDQGSEHDETFPNKWPSDDKLPGFRSFMEHFYKSSEKVSLQLLQALEESLKLPRGAFCQNVKEASELRVNHYPPVTLERMRGGSVNRIWPHFDLGILTLLWTRGASGLEFQDRMEKDKFIPLQQESPYELIVNVSETLQRWTNDILPAGLHQVTIPRALRNMDDGVIPERYSIAYFCKADRNALVGTLAHFIDSVDDAKYENVTALEYHRARLHDAYEGLK